MKDNHECKEGRFKMDCPICQTDMHNSVLSSTILKCGHAMHSKCAKEYINTNIACPICKKSIVDMEEYETYYDQ
jgi:RING finger/CHY zinc finger protein 1